MTIQTINLGNVVNDGLGDDLRTAFQKVNANFSSLATELSISGINLGEGLGAEVFKQRTGTNLQFRKLQAGTNMSLDQTDNSIIINNVGADAFKRIETDAGVIVAGSTDSSRNITIQGGPSGDVDVTAFGQVVTVNTVLPFKKILTTYDFGPIGYNFENVAQLTLAASNIDFGTVQLPGRIDLDCGPIVV